MATDDRRSSRSLPAVPPSRQMRWRHPILVLDADPVGGQQAAEVLTSIGLDVEVMERPEELLERAAMHPSTVMVVEVPLQGMSETVLLSTAQRMTGLKVMPIVLTSRTYPEDGSVAKSLLAQGAVDFVGRPARSLRWRSALTRALSDLQMESAKLTSLQKKRSRPTHSREFSVPPAVFGDSSADLHSSRHDGLSRSADPLRPHASSSRPLRQGPTAAEVLSASDRRDLAAKGFKAPLEAIAGNLLTKVPPAGPTFVWQATETQLTIACIGQEHAHGAEIRLSFTIPDPKTGRDGRPRVIGRVAQARGYPWGNLVRLQVIGAAPRADYDRLIEIVGRFGNWSLD